MEQVTIAEAQVRLADLIAAAQRGETVIIVGTDLVAYQIVPLSDANNFIRPDGPMSEDFDETWEPWELVPSRLVEKYPELRAWREGDSGSG